MSKSDSPSLNLPTAADLRLWERELYALKEEQDEMKARHKAEEKALEERRSRFDRLISAASAFLEVFNDDEPASEGRDPTRHPAPVAEESKGEKPKPYKRRPKKLSWTATMLRLIKRADRGLAYAELKELVLDTHLGETLARTDKAFYGGIRKLEKAGDIIKYKGYLFSSATYKKFKADLAVGLIEDLPDISSQREGESPNEIAVRRFVAEQPNGVSTAAIVNHLLNNPPSDLVITKNRNSIYNLLSRWRRKGTLFKREGKYFLPPQENEAPTGNAEGASETGGAATPLFESRKVVTNLFG
jgi:hypothetical protein